MESIQDHHDAKKSTIQDHKTTKHKVNTMKRRTRIYGLSVANRKT